MANSAIEKLARSSAGYTVAGLAAGVFYREFSRFHKFDTTAVQTQLRTLHTHSFALGTLFMLIVLLLEKNFNLSAQQSYKKFYGLYHSGLGITLTCMLVQGCMVTTGRERNLIVTWCAGLGHSIVGASFYFFYKTLLGAIKTSSKK
eukprot:gene1361-796_t